MREYGSEHPAITLPDGYFERLGELRREILFLRTGREALLLAALALSSTSNKIILFPAYCCWSMSAPFERAGWTVIYYRLNSDLTVELDYLCKLIGIYKPKAVLTMNYYGSACTNEAVALIKKLDPNIKVIEDFSHCTFSIRKIFNPLVDIYVSSIRKSIGVCDGSVILSKELLPKQYIQNEECCFADERYFAQKDKKFYNWSKNQNLKQEFLSVIRKCERKIDDFSVVRPISNRAMQMLKLVNAEEISYARKENMCHLWNLLNKKVEMVPSLERCFNGAPFSLPILVENRDIIQTELAKKGVYTQLLWPICKEAQAICPVSKKNE